MHSTVYQTICISDGLMLLIMHMVYGSWNIITSLFKLMPRWMKHLVCDNQSKKQGWVDFLFLFATCTHNSDTSTQLWFSDGELTLWQMFKAKVTEHTVDRKTSSAQSTIIQDIISQLDKRPLRHTHVCPAVCLDGVGRRDMARVRGSLGAISHEETCVTSLDTTSS